MPSAGQCGHDEVRDAVRSFVDSWNDHDQATLGQLFADRANLTMSTKDQRAAPPATHGGYESVSGWDAIQLFVGVQWHLGESLHFTSLQPFDGGAYALKMTATFNDGSTQPFSEAKFAFDCSAQAFDHVEIVSAAEAS